MDSIFDSNVAYRSLTVDEILQMERQGCTAEDWSKVKVNPDFSAAYIHQSHFSGVNHLGSFNKYYTLKSGITRHSGIYRSTLHNTAIGNDCFISDIHGGIANYKIEKECFISNTDTIVVDSETSFGQGTEIVVLSETGGREIIIHDQLSSHEAYMQAMYRHDKKLNEKLRSIAYKRAEEVRRHYGFIESGSVITRCGILRNLYIHSFSKIEGATRLENGTICSTLESPCYIGDNVIAHDFIFQNGCKITDGAMLHRCYVGQACVIGHGYSASDSFFGCNCQAENGEACAIFAGPYTVTHHKSTLLIGGMFSFMNAGSGTNQSNHMYKLGPSHHGILERGCKTASGAHILWPAKVGPFSMIMGHYNCHADTGIFPFSYIIEQKNENYLIPGIALRNIGTLRDIHKWPKRDGRHPDTIQQDFITFDAYSPYTIGRMLKGVAILKDIDKSLDEDETITKWNGLSLKRKSITNGLDLYRMAINRFIGDKLLEKLNELSHLPIEQLYDAMKPSVPYCPNWIDLCGLQVPECEVERLEKDIKKEIITSAEQLSERFARISESYNDYVWAWVWQRLLLMYPNTTNENFISTVCFPIICQWESATYALNDRAIKDAQKEFSSDTCVGFGTDGDEETKIKDFIAVRGKLEENSFVKDIEQERERTKETAAKWIQKLTT